MTPERKRRIEFGDFQTPDELALSVCIRLSSMGIQPDIVVEPTCGTGAFIVSAAKIFQNAKHFFGFEINSSYLETLTSNLSGLETAEKISLEKTDFFSTDWKQKIGSMKGSLLVIGNFPWVTNTVQGCIGGINLPKKSNFLGFNGYDAITGSSNFDISEWMLIEVLRWFENRPGDIAFLVKTSVARKILAYSEKQTMSIKEAFIIRIDAKKHFGASVEACLFIIRFGGILFQKNNDYMVFDGFNDIQGRKVGHRQGVMVSNLDAFESNQFIFGKSPQKWRSGVKHDASKVMELTRIQDGYKNGLEEIIQIENNYLYPLLKGSDVAGNKDWRDKFILVTQQYVGEQTDIICLRAPKTWAYLESHSNYLDMRTSIVYKKNPRFSIFGIGDYAFRPWKIAICGLYKFLYFRLIGPIENRPVMFDDTVNYLSFNSEEEAKEVLEKLNSPAIGNLLSSLIFWDEKRPIKTKILNLVDWSRVDKKDFPLFSCTQTTTIGFPPMRD